MMKKGGILLAEDSTGRDCSAAFIPKFAVHAVIWAACRQTPHIRERASDACSLKPPRIICTARDARLVDILVLSMRPELPPLYRKFGYMETGTEEFHISRPLKAGIECHCIVMSKLL